MKLLLSFFALSASLNSYASPNLYTPVIDHGVPVAPKSQIQRMTVQLVLHLEDGRKALCTGFIADQRKIITAGHCVAMELKSIEVRFFNGSNGEVQDTYEAESWAAEPSYSISNFPNTAGFGQNERDGLLTARHDIAVVTLSDDIPDYAVVADMVKHPVDLKGLVVWVAGYGLHGVVETDVLKTPFLRAAQMRVRTLSKDAAILDSVNGLIDHGDSGGPCYYLVGGKVQVFAVNSNGYDFAGVAVLWGNSKFLNEQIFSNN